MIFINKPSWHEGLLQGGNCFKHGVYLYPIHGICSYLMPTIHPLKLGLLLKKKFFHFWILYFQIMVLDFDGPSSFLDGPSSFFDEAKYNLQAISEHVIWENIQGIYSRF